MRTKTLLLAVALSAATLATAVAQTVYSVNAVGYVNVTVGNGQFAFLANPLQTGSNTVANVLPDVPKNTTVYKYDSAGGSWVTAGKNALGKWTGSTAMTLNPGEGFFVKNGSGADTTITFVGEVVQGTNVAINVPAGYSMLGSAIPQAGKLATDLKLPAKKGDTILVYRNGSYSSFSINALGKWTPSEPELQVAEGFWFKTANATTWTRDFNVNQ